MWLAVNKSVIEKIIEVHYVFILSVLNILQPSIIMTNVMADDRIREVSLRAYPTLLSMLYDELVLTTPITLYNISVTFRLSANCRRKDVSARRPVDLWKTLPPVSSRGYLCLGRSTFSQYVTWLPAFVQLEKICW